MAGAGNVNVSSSSMLLRCQLLLVLAACAGTPPPAGDAPGRPGVERPRVRRHGDEIVVAGTWVRIGTPVVLWTDPDGYDAYSLEPRFPQEAHGPLIQGRRRYGHRPDLGDAPTLTEVQAAVDQFVVHYDVCGTSRQCFKILQDIRCLSVHFLLDVDGTIYQTLDVQERAWHATVANDRAVGIEIAHIGAYPAPGHPTLRAWYESDAAGTRITVPKTMPVTGIRTPDFVARPAHAALSTGTIHGRPYWQYDFTHEQYCALAHLVAALQRVLPRLELDVPRDAEGRVLATFLTREELAAYRGLLGHWHVQENKVDPGPAFDWERLLREARLLRSTSDE